MTLLLCILSLFLLYRYLKMKKALQDLSQDMAYRREEQSNRLLTSFLNDKDLHQVIREANQLFDDLQTLRIKNLQEKNSLDQAIHNIAHDIRTPLTVASGYCQQLLDSKGSLDSVEKEKLLKINQHLSQVAHRLEELLSYQKLIEGQVQVQLEPVDLSQAVKENLLHYYDRLNDDFQIHLAIEEACYIDNSPDLLNRILDNLLGNVIKHGHSTLNIQVKKDQDEVHLTLSNQSQQAVQHLDQLTKRFYAENLAKDQLSSGLGLFIIQELVDLTQGQLSMTYQKGSFTSQITWPASEGTD
ncbi:sensor histidine kinase [Aerococcus urinae]